MPVNYKIIQAKDFIKARPTGEIDLNESKKVLGQVAEMAAVIGECEILMDVRDAYGNLDQEDLLELVLEFGRHREAFRNKVAVLAREGEQFNKAVLVEMFAKIDGFSVIAFTDFEKATTWLQSDDGMDELWT